MAELTDLDILALTLYGEVRGESPDGKLGVANIIRNRMKTGRWGTSLSSVCLAPWQFSCWEPKGGLSNWQTIQELKRELQTGQAISDPVYQACVAVAQSIVDESAADNVFGATHYYVQGTTTPAWAIGKTPVCQIGKHLFYAHIA